MLFIDNYEQYSYTKIIVPITLQESPSDYDELSYYYHIGEGKLRMLIDQNPHEDFYVMNGNRVLIKRAKFERYLDQATAV